MILERVSDFAQVCLRGVVKAPVLAHDVRDVVTIDRFPSGRSHFVLGQKHDAVDEVVRREFVNLELREQQIRDRDRWRVQLQTAGEVDRVGHYQLIKKDVDLDVGPRVLVNEALDAEFLGQADGRVQDITPCLEQGGDLALLLRVSHQVDVAVGPAAECHEQMRLGGAVGADCDRSRQPHCQRPAGGNLHQLVRLSQHRLGSCDFIRRFGGAHCRGSIVMSRNTSSHSLCLVSALMSEASPIIRMPAGPVPAQAYCP
jgi:hypothetical protein